MNQERIAVVGLGYVGLPIAVALAGKYETVYGFDISKPRIEELKSGQDSTLEIEPEKLKKANIHYTANPEDLRDVTFFIITVPTPIDENKQPDLSPVVKASETVGKILSKGAIVAYESTVYPGVTEDICRPILAAESGLEPGVDFHVAYSPERINPGDKEHTIDKIVKVVAAEDDASLKRSVAVYGSIVTAGIHQAPSIKVAEAAKVIENTQRDLNIALMNELALIFERLGISTRDVLEAAGTKWNFLPFRPGLVGGHCIGVDPYYLTTKAQSVGYHPEVILAGRRINDNMGAHIARTLVKSMVNNGFQVRGAKVGVLGLTFKENVPDLRNSRVPDIIRELKEFGVECLVHDPMVTSEFAEEEYGIELHDLKELRDLDALVLAVSHQPYVQMGAKTLSRMLKKQGVFVDVKSVFRPSDFGSEVSYWSL